GAGVGARAFGADEQARAVPAADRAAARRHRVDAQHRGADARARDDRLVIAFEAPGIMADVGRGAAHVEADEARLAQGRGAADHADDAARRAREDRVAAVESGGGGEAARAFHELRVDAPLRSGAELGDELAHIMVEY